MPNFKPSQPRNSPKTALSSAGSLPAPNQLFYAPSSLALRPFSRARQKTLLSYFLHSRSNGPSSMSPFPRLRIRVSGACSARISTKRALRSLATMVCTLPTLRSGAVPLELSYAALRGPILEDALPEPPLDDPIVGRYIYVSPPIWGRTKVFYEQSGDDQKRDILFLHTSGADSRQYHGVMTDPRMLSKCRMTAFDLPGHGRSFPSETQIPGRHANSEDAYICCIH